jgi:zinc D-Ala-D-Ala carboxypeptidase
MTGTPSEPLTHRTAGRTPHGHRLALATLLALGILIPLSAADPLAPSVDASSSPPACTYKDLLTPARSLSDWDHTLLDTIYRVPATYAPKDLVPVSRAGVAGSGSVRKLVVVDLAALSKAARAAGAPVAIQSAYRSYATQVSVFAGWVRKLGYAQALRGSARPGHSEHQLGTAIDFKSSGGPAPWYANGFDWAKTRAGSWMAANAWRYGFVLSYPNGKFRTVCYGYEPWHYRYVGRSAAKAIHDSGLTPREWLWRNPSGLATES